MQGVWVFESEDQLAVLTLLRTHRGWWAYERVHSGDGTVQSSLQLPKGSYTNAAGAVVTTEFSDTDLNVVIDHPAHGQVKIHRQLVDGKLHCAAAGETVVYERSSTKQVLVYRRDLKMRKGKIAAQCAHGSLAVFFRSAGGPVDELVIPLDGPMAHWSSRGFAKIVLSVEDEEQLLQVAALAKEMNLPHSLITDAGRTEFKGVPTRTVVAIGPAEITELDRITGKEGAVSCKLA